MATALADELTQVHFRAMGTDAHIAVLGGDQAVLQLGVGRVRELEARWSRFLDTSEVAALNRDEGRPVIVSDDTFTLVRRALTAWEATGGRFDPTVGAALVAHGYDRDFRDVRNCAAGTPCTTGPTLGAAGIELVAGINAITLPFGVTFDPGGIGKGLAADLTAALLLAAGARGALVNVGGDLRVTGQAPTPDGWPITVADPLHADRELLRAAINEGAVATSSRLLRRWQTATGEAHHLIDPTTGRPADTDVLAVTVIAGDGWWAEALSKALFLTGVDGLADIDDAHAVVITADGARHATTELEATLR